MRIGEDTLKSAIVNGIRIDLRLDYALNKLELVLTHCSAAYTGLPEELCELGYGFEYWNTNLWQGNLRSAISEACYFAFKQVKSEVHTGWKDQSVLSTARVGGGA
jgi:hypothetical protein